MTWLKITAKTAEPTETTKGHFRFEIDTVWYLKIWQSEIYNEQSEIAFLCDLCVLCG
jgi:hypothetical protein